MSRRIVARPLTREAFAPFGDVLDTRGDTHFPINGGRCERHHALAAVDVAGEDAILSIFCGTPYALPLDLSMVERHPFGSQAFMPLGPGVFLIVVCPDEAGRPGRPEAFLTAPGQGVSYRRNVWHAALTPVGTRQDFLVVDRRSPETNLEEHRFDEPWVIAIEGAAAP